MTDIGAPDFGEAGVTDTDFERRYARLSGPARQLLDGWLAAAPAADTENSPVHEPALPETEAQALLVQVWQEVLERDRIGIDDDYFEVGGDSIRAIVIVARAEAAGLRISTRDVLDVRTIRSLAALGEPVAVTRSRASSVASVDAPLTALQEGILFHTLAAEPGVYLAQVGCDLVGDLAPETFRAAWQHVLSRHQALRSTFHWSGNAPPVRRIAAVAALNWTERDFRGLSEAEQQHQLRGYQSQVATEGFDLGVGPLLKLGLFRTAERTHRFVFTHHHLLLDGWSQHYVFSDVLAAYGSLLAGREPQLPERSGPDVQSPAPLYGRDPRDPTDDREPAGGDARTVEAAAFWRAELEGITSSPASEPILTSHASITESLNLPPAVMSGAAAYCRAIGVTPALAFQAAWAGSPVPTGGSTSLPTSSRREPARGRGHRRHDLRTIVSRSRPHRGSGDVHRHAADACPLLGGRAVESLADHPAPAPVAGA